MYEKIIASFGDYWQDKGQQCRGMLTTKEVAEITGLSAPKAYALMKDLEGQELAYNIGIRVRGGQYEPSDGLGAAKAKSITWQIYQDS